MKILIAVLLLSLVGCGSNNDINLSGYTVPKDYPKFTEECIAGEKYWVNSNSKISKGVSCKE